MITQLPYDDQSTVAVRFNKKITDEDYDYLLPMLEDKLERHDRLNLYCEFDAVKGMELNAAIRDGKFYLRHRGEFNKIAVVGDSKWLDLMMKFGNYFSSGELKYFDKAHGDEALMWLKKEKVQS